MTVADKKGISCGAAMLMRCCVGHHFFTSLFVGAVTVLSLYNPGALTAEETLEIDYRRDIAPIFEHRCQTCHGALKQEGGLRLDAGVLVRKGGDSGDTIVPDNPDSSHLLTAISGKEGDWRMPPEGKPVPANEVDLIKRWISSGAKIPDHEEIPVGPKDHWFFKSPISAPLPSIADARFAQHPIDRFLAERWEKERLVPQDVADRATLLRRVTFDLTGLPPTRAELRAFLDDQSDNAYEAVVDRLLESTAYGERWGRHWLDIWRYSDPIYDTSCQQGGLVLAEYHMWRYRDWVVESLNGDKGYDQMIREMLAGDELAPSDPETRRATGYLTRSHTAVGNRDTFLQDVVEHAGQAFLGLTLRCARCHDHKYDPISQEDYYRFRAFFEPISVRLDRLPGAKTAREVGVNSITDGDHRETFLYVNGSPMQPDKKRGPLAPKPLALFTISALEPTPIPVPAYVAYPGLQRWIQEDAVAAAEAAIEQASKKLETLRTSVSNGSTAEIRLAETEVAVAEATLTATRAVIQADLAAAEGKETASSLAKYAALTQRIEEITTVERDIAKEEVHLESVSKSGQDNQPSDAEQITAARDKIESLKKKLGELQAKRDVESDDYEGLTPRYARESTGRRTALAAWITDRTNPATARVAVNHVWLRHMGSPLVSTVQDFGLNGRKPTHPQLLDWLAVDFMEHGWRLKHLHRQIVTSQAYRMSSARMPGHPNEQLDPENRLIWRMNPRRLEAEAIRDALWMLGPGLDRTLGGPPTTVEQANTTARRGIYLNHTADERDMMLRVFDSANPDECYRREDSVAPHQSLAMTNGDFVHKMAQAATERIDREVGSDDARFARVAFEQILCRAPTDQELSHCIVLIRALTEADAANPESDARPLPVGRVSLIRALVNTADFITLR